jgi:hypothetical protein
MKMSHKSSSFRCCFGAFEVLKTINNAILGVRIDDSTYCIRPGQVEVKILVRILHQRGKRVEQHFRSERGPYCLVIGGRSKAHDCGENEEECRPHFL